MSVNLYTKANQLRMRIRRKELEIMHAKKELKAMYTQLRLTYIRMPQTNTGGK